MTSASTRTRSFTIVAVAFLVAMVGTTLPSPLYPIYAVDFGFSRLTITVVFAMYAVGVIGALVTLGDLSDRIGRKRTLLPGLAAAAISALCFLFAHGLVLVLVGRFFSGLSAGIFTGTATATLLDLVPESRRDRASVIATVVNMGGLGLGPVLSGVVAEWLPHPLRTVFAVHLALTAVVALGLVSIPEPSEASGRFAIRPRGLTVPDQVRAEFLRAATAGFAGFAMLGLYGAVVPTFLADSVGVTNHAVVGLVAFGAFFGSVVGQLLRRTVPDTVALAGGCAVLVVGAALVVLAVHAGSLVLMLVAALVAGSGQGLSFAAGVARVAVGSPAEQRAAVTSSLFVAMYVAISLPVVGVGLLAQAAGIVTAATVFSIAVGVLAVAAAASLALDRGGTAT